MATLSNPKHELYCHYRALGLTQAESYKRAFNSISVTNICADKGCAFESDPIIKQRIDQLKDWNASKMLFTREKVAKMILELYNNAELESTKTKLLAQLNKMFGFNEPDKFDLNLGTQDKISTFASLFNSEDTEEDTIIDE